jgi:hypothetical protein
MGGIMSAKVEARKNSVKHLAELYSVVIAAAVTLAMYNAIDANSWFIFSDNSWVLFFAFIMMVVPFYHGAVRHLYATYIESGGSSKIKNSALFIDYFLLFSHGALFVALASTLSQPDRFATVLCAILVIDCVWGLLAHLTLTGAASQDAEKNWASINFVTAFVVILLLAGWNIAPGLPDQEWASVALSFLLLAIVGVRTVIDYRTSWDFYFPTDTPTPPAP